MSISFPDDDNGAMLQSLREHHFDFTIEHPVDFFALLPNEQAAQQLAGHFRPLQQDYPTITHIELRPAVDGRQTELIITRQMLVSYDSVKQFENELHGLCKPHKGSSDGWGVLQDAEE